MTDRDITTPGMTRGERTDLAQLIRRREKLYKAEAKQRALELVADFEKQLDHQFSYDDDVKWKAAYTKAEEVVKEAQDVIKQQCSKLGIPPEFAPSLHLGWSTQGQNASKERRTELRRLAKTQIDAMEAGAKTLIEQASVDQQTVLVSDGLTSKAAHAFLEQMPIAQNLMPALDFQRIKALMGPDEER